MESIADTDVHPGQILAGKFRIERILGRGGMGVVVAATHLQLDEKVALKFLLPEALKNVEAVRRFEREARAAVKIKSEHVARVTDVGKLETGAPYMVMEFLHGMDLGQYLEKMGPLPLQEAVEYLLQATEAIAEAHSLGIIHRDLKPANLYRIVRSDGSPSIKVLDFGISKVTTGDDASMTHTSSMMGSPYYMSPEQMASAKNVDQRTDVWALGIILHELLTGNVPYDGQTIPEVCAKVLQYPAPQLEPLRPDLPRDLDFVLKKALEKKRDDRYADVAQFALALSTYANDDGRRSVERISKVLGVTHSSSDPSGSNPERNSTQLAKPYDARASLGAQVGDQAEVSRSATAEPSTLGGAAHTQLDYKPPTSGIDHKILLLAVGGILLIGGVVFALSGRSDQSAAQETLVATDSESPVTSPVASATEAEAPEAEAPEAEAPEAEDKVATAQPEKSNPHGKQDPPGLSAGPQGAQKTAATPAPPGSATPTPLRPARQTAVTSAPQPRVPAPAAVPTPAPAPAPAPRTAPAPSPESLYLDRR